MTSPVFRLWLVMIIGVPLALLGFWIVVRIETVDGTGLPTGLAIYYHVVILFILMIGVTTVCRRIKESWVLSRCELLCLYSMMAIGSSYGSWEAMGTLVPSIGYMASRLARPGNTDAWIIPVLRDIPSWAAVHDPSAAYMLFGGGPWDTMWRAWALPLVSWGILLSVLYLMFLALVHLLYDPWAHQERLSFPLTMLPVAMSDPQSSLWKSWLFWLGAIPAFGLDLMNGLHQLFPTLPAVNVKMVMLNTAATDPALLALGPVPLTFHPLMFGLGFLLRTDLLFSIWFFYVVGKLETYLVGLTGAAHGSPYALAGNVPGLLAQNFGAVVVISIGWLWQARRHLAHLWTAARKGDPGARCSYGCLGVGCLVMGIAFMQLGLPIWAAVIALTVLLLLALLVTQLRGSLGLPAHNLQFMGPDAPIIALFSGNNLGQHGLEAFGSLYACSRSLQGHPMPHQMEAVYMQDLMGAIQTRFRWAIGLAGVMVALLGPWIFLYMASRRGLDTTGATYYGPIWNNGWDLLHHQLSTPPYADPIAVLEMLAGASVTFGLIMLGRTWIASPFMPIGYAISGSWGTGIIATPILLIWIVKVLLLRYGGLKQYRAAIPFALGLVVGEFTAGAFWTVVSLVAHVQTYRIWLI